MRNYALELQKLSEELNNEIIDAYDTVVKKHGERPVQIGRNPPQLNTFEIPLRLETRIEKFFTKVNGIGYDRSNGINQRKFFIKGFQVARGRYRMKPLHYMSIEERQVVLEHLIKRYGL